MRLIKFIKIKNQNKISQILDFIIVWKLILGQKMLYTEISRNIPVFISSSYYKLNGYSFKQETAKFSNIFIKKLLSVSNICKCCFQYLNNILHGFFFFASLPLYYMLPLKKASKNSKQTNKNPPDYIISSNSSPIKFFLL